MFTGRYEVPDGLKTLQRHTVCLGAKIMYFVFKYILCRKWYLIERYLWLRTLYCPKMNLYLSILMELWHFEFLEGGLKIRKIGENWTSHFCFSNCFSAHERENLFKSLSPRTTEASALGEKVRYISVHQLLRNNCAKFGTAHFLAKSGWVHFGSRNWSCFCLNG